MWGIKMTTYILEYDDVGMQENQNSFANPQFQHKRGFTSMQELNEAISKLPGGTKGRYDDGDNLCHFTAGEAGTVITSRGLPSKPL
jgi:hypothetical protein